MRKNINNHLRIRVLILYPVLLLFLISGPVSSQEKDQPVPRGHFFAQFRDIEISDFLKTMAQITKRNILIDDSVKGKITIVSYKPIPISRAMDFLKQVLEVKGFAVVEEPNLIKVIANKDAQAASMPEEIEPDYLSTGLVTRVLNLPGSVKIADMNSLVKSIGGKDTLVVPHTQTNSLIITGYAQNVRRALEIVKKVLPSSGDDGSGPIDTTGVHIYRCRHMNADTLAQVLVKLDNPDIAAAAPPGDPNAPKAPVINVSTPGGNKIKAVAHKESNSIVVTATAGEWREIEQIIRALDQQRKQILLEVLIAEVSSDRTNDFGIDWRVNSSSSGHSQFNSGLAAQGGLVNPETGKITGNNTLSGFSLGFLDKGGDILAIFNANMSRSNFNVLSAPQVLTLDNQEAEINVGQDVPVQTQQRTSGGGTSESTINSFEYRPAGIKLKVTPNINNQGNITLDLYQEVTNIAQVTTAEGSNPTFNKRTVKTFVNVDDKQTIVIGGLVNTEKQQSVSKIPILGDIPLLGFIFRRTTYTTKRTNLMVFITPHVLTDRSEADRISNFKRREQIRATRETTNELKLWPQRQVPQRREEQLERIKDY